MQTADVWSHMNQPKYTFISFPFFLPPATKLGQGYVLTGVCDSVHKGWGLYPSMHHRSYDQEGLSLGRGFCLREGLCPGGSVSRGSLTRGSLSGGEGSLLLYGNEQVVHILQEFILVSNSLFSFWDFFWGGAAVL